MEYGIAIRGILSSGTGLIVFGKNERGERNKERKSDGCQWLNVCISVHPSSTSHFIMPARDNSMEMKWQ